MNNTLFFLLSLYLLFLMMLTGNVANSFWFLLSSPDYQDVITRRADMMLAMNTRYAIYYESAYVCLPVLSFISLWWWSRDRSRVWLTTFSIQVAIIIFFLFSSLQKAPILFYGISLTMGLILVGRFRVRAVLLAILAGFVFLSSMQLLFVEDWSFYKSIVHVFFRVASSFPFFLSVYPAYENFQPNTMGLGTLGLLGTIRDNIVVANYMWPDLLWVQNATTASSHVRAYTQGGWAPVFAVLMIVVFLIHLFGRMLKCVRGPVGFALLVQGGVTLYHLTQTSLFGALRESYGLQWGVVILLAFVITREIVTALNQSTLLNKRYSK